MSIALTAAAADHIQRQLDSRGRGLGIRLAVTTTGCSGLAYVLEFVDEPDGQDTVLTERGIKLFIDPKSLVYLDGTRVDFSREGVNEGLTFVNPNAAGECGCGESFHV